MGLRYSRGRSVVFHQCYFESPLTHTNQVLDSRWFAAIQLLVNIIRLCRPHYPELLDRVWNMIRRCWHHNPPRHVPIGNTALVLGVDTS